MSTITATKFTLDTNMLNLVTQLLMAKALGQDREVTRLRQRAIMAIMLRFGAVDDETDETIAEEHLDNVINFFSKLEL